MLDGRQKWIKSVHKVRREETGAKVKKEIQRSKLEGLELNNTSLARRLGLHRHTVRRYKKELKLA